MNKTELARKIQTLDGLSNEEKTALLELIRGHKKYGLVWEEKPEDIEEQLREDLPVLTEVSDRAIISNNPDAPNHLIIEGDNLAALTELCYTHAGKIDVIYIDPPYNTGKDDEFKYNDNYVDKEDTFRHSKWISFLRKRISLAKILMKESGVIFISIDDYSFAQLKLLCDEIFEYSSNPDSWNFLGCLIWNKQHSQQQGTFKKYHEYVLVYSKNKKFIKNVLSKAEGVIEAGAMKKISSKNPASEFTFPAGTKFEAPDGTVLTGTYGDSEKVTVIDGIFEAQNGVTKYPVTLYAGWTQKKQMQSWFSGQDTFDTKGQQIIEFYFNSKGKIKCRKTRAVTTPPSLLPLFGMGSEQTEYLDNILGVTGKFTNPKPEKMIELFIDWFCPENGIVLDFFAGSGTTLDSTMQLNLLGGKRTCILCTNNENNICEEVTYERNKRIINGYTKFNGEYVEGLHDNNLRYFRTEFLPRERTAKNMRQLVEASTGLLCIKNDLYTEATFGGRKMNQKYARYFDDGKQQMLVIYEERAIPFIVNIIKTLPKSENKIKVYVFSHGSYAYTDEFAEVAERVEPCALPQAIYDAYLKVLPKRKPKFFVDELVTEIVETEQNEIQEQGTLDFGDNEDEKGGAE